RRAALGAGAKILASYSYELNKEDVEELLRLKPEIILFAGGTDGGNKHTIINNAKVLAQFDIKIPIIIACNKSAQPTIAEIFKEANFNFYRSSNVMPSINVLNVEEVRDIIREVFMKHIVNAKGLENAVKYIGDVLMPTPAAVLKAAELLSHGTEEIDGLDDLVVVDIGGATTDIHSLSNGYPSKGGVTMKGLEEPFAKRSVEGDLGMRYSALSCYHAAGYRYFEKHSLIPIKKDEVECAINKRHEDIELEPDNDFDVNFDITIGRVCTDLAMTRHAGYLELSYSPFGSMISQYGKDLTAIKYLIGTGGVLVYNNFPKEILSAGLFDQNDPNVLKPINPQLLLDKSYILSSMGLLATRNPELAIKIMKKYIINLNEGVK
ncbi:MAG: glutamate mutase L, partial [Bacilli bacterium]|nr:glutamate mutase L [Bacilli bacterium]